MKEQISTKEQIRRYENFLGTVKKYITSLESCKTDKYNKFDTCDKYIEEQEDEQIRNSIWIPSSERQTSNLFGRFAVINGFIPVSI